jgi:hypothetical protein
MGNVIFVIVWFLSGLGVWWHYRQAYSPGGLWHGQRPNLLDFVDIFVPLWNTISLFIAWVIVGVPIKGRPKKKCRKFNFFNWFYQLKKNEE